MKRRVKVFNEVMSGHSSDGGVRITGRVNQCLAKYPGASVQWLQSSVPSRYEKYDSILTHITAIVTYETENEDEETE